MTNKVKALFLQSSFLNIVFIMKQDQVLKVFYDTKDNEVKLNSIYRGKIVDKSTAMGCFFVKIDDNNIALLKFHKNNQHLKVGESLIVQIIRESLDSKTLNDFDDKANIDYKKHCLCSEEIALVGKFIIHKPFSNMFVIAKPMEENRKNELKNLAVFQNYGGILRSTYSYANLELASIEAINLKNLFLEITDKLPNQIGLLYAENLWHRACFDSSNYEVEEITFHCIENLGIELTNISDYPNVRHYIKKEFIVEEFNLIEAVDTIFTSHYPINEAIELVVMQNSSFNYIDVDFKNDNFFNSKEENAYRVNMQVLPSIVKLIELKNCAGQIFVDLLKLHNKNYHKNIVVAINQLFVKEGVKANALGFSNLGLLEILRQKHKIPTSLNFDLKNKLELLFLLLKIEFIHVNEVTNKIIISLPKAKLDLLKQSAKTEYIKCINYYGAVFEVNNTNEIKISIEK